MIYLHLLFDIISYIFDISRSTLTRLMPFHIARRAAMLIANALFIPFSIFVFRRLEVLSTFDIMTFRAIVANIIVIMMTLIHARRQKETMEQMTLYLQQRAADAFTSSFILKCAPEVGFTPLSGHSRIFLKRVMQIALSLE